MVVVHGNMDKKTSSLGVQAWAAWLRLAEAVESYPPRVVVGKARFYHLLFQGGDQQLCAVSAALNFSKQHYLVVGTSATVVTEPSDTQLVCRGWCKTFGLWKLLELY